MQSSRYARWASVLWRMQQNCRIAKSHASTMYKATKSYLTKDERCGRRMLERVLRLALICHDEWAIGDWPDYDTTKETTRTVGRLPDGADAG